MLIIRLLGAQAVLDGATGRIRTGSSRTLALLGLLIAHTGRPQDRATIAGQFWPESGDGQALTNLRREPKSSAGTTRTTSSTSTRTSGQATDAMPAAPVP